MGPSDCAREVASASHKSIALKSLGAKASRSNTVVRGGGYKSNPVNSGLIETMHSYYY